MISAVFQAFLRDWLWVFVVFVSRGVGMSLADGVTGVVLADGGVAGSEARMRAHWLPLADPIRRILTVMCPEVPMRQQVASKSKAVTEVTALESKSNSLSTSAAAFARLPSGLSDPTRRSIRR